MNALAIHLYLTIRHINLSFNYFGNFYRIIVNWLISLNISNIFIYDYSRIYQLATVNLSTFFMGQKLNEKHSFIIENSTSSNLDMKEKFRILTAPSF